MICCKDVSRAVVLKIILNKIINTFGYMVNNFNIVEINGGVGPMRMAIRVTAK